MSLYPSSRLFPSENLYPNVVITFDFSGLTNYNNIKASRKNGALASNLQDATISSRERTNNIDSSPENNGLYPSSIKGNKIT